MLGVQPPHQVQQGRTGRGVEIGGWLIGQDNRRLTDDGPGHRDTLLLAAGEFMGQTLFHPLQPDLRENAPGLGPSFPKRNAAKHQHILHILLSRQDADKVVFLKHKTDFPQPQNGALLAAEPGDFLTRHLNAPRIRFVQGPDLVQ
ncbi:hypothetical protein ASQ50_06940 [Marinobacter sp. LQ44]|nr:hypothetical protein ASQ50_06940 [Marinobacter sp. LQ44]